MSKKTKEDGYDAVESVWEPSAGAAEPTTFLAIEDHAKAWRVTAPVFAAVCQMRGWATGKKMEEAEFNAAVNAFLGAPVGGKR
jgi:hypothetical protein